MYQLTENFGGMIGNLKMKLFLYIKRVHNIFDCCRVAHVNRIFSKAQFHISKSSRQMIYLKWKITSLIDLSGS